MDYYDDDEQGFGGDLHPIIPFLIVGVAFVVAYLFYMGVAL